MSYLLLAKVYHDIFKLNLSDGFSVNQDNQTHIDIRI
jgi:hypothetical protein